MITSRTLALICFAPVFLLDQLAAAPNQVVRVKHEQYGGRLVGYLEPHAGLRLQPEWNVDSNVSYSPLLRLDAVSRAAETEWDGSVARLARKYS
ncbi:hypothetical protein EDB89DRAFT_2005077, partial [Lactarius sanguifluus]